MIDGCLSFSGSLLRLHLEVSTREGSGFHVPSIAGRWQASVPPTWASQVCSSFPEHEGEEYPRQKPQSFDPLVFRRDVSLLPKFSSLKVSHPLSPCSRGEGITWGCECQEAGVRAVAEVACHRIRVWAASCKWWGLEVIRGQGVSRAGFPNPNPQPRPSLAPLAAGREQRPVRVINELREPEGHQLLPWPVCSHPDVGLLQPKPQRRWPHQPGRVGMVITAPIRKWSAECPPISSSGMLHLSAPPSRTIGRFLKMQIPESGRKLHPRSGSGPQR